MTPADRIIDACRRVTDKGFKVARGSYGVGLNAKKKWAPLRRAKKCLCPLGALVAVEKPAPGRYGTVPEAVGSLLSVDMGWVLEFQATFDRVAIGLEGPGADAARAVLSWLADRSREAPPAAASPSAPEGSGAEEPAPPPSLSP